MDINSDTSGQVTITSFERFIPIVSQQKKSAGCFIVQLSLTTASSPIQIMMNLGEKDQISHIIQPGDSLLLAADNLHARYETEPKKGKSTSTALNYSLVGFNPYT